MSSSLVLDPPSHRVGFPARRSDRSSIPESNPLRERVFIWTLLALLLVLRVMSAFHVRIDSDEPQHLHIIWAWSHGLLQYRDVFDNHAPLFQMLCAPLFRLLGEHAEVIIWMRLAVLPLAGVCLWSVYQIGNALWDRRTGLWAALAAGYCPIFFIKSTEFRTDDLWAALWLLAMVILFCAPLTRLRAFLFGLTAGATFATSLKTSLLLSTLAAGGVLVLSIRLWRRQPVEWPRLLSLAVLALAGALIIPLAFVAFFAAHGALHDLYYCTVQHNVMPRLKRWGHFQRHAFLLPAAFPVLLAVAWFLIRWARNAGLGEMRALLFLSTTFYITALYSYWPDITGEDFIPFVPLAALVVMGFVVGTQQMLTRRGIFRSWLLALPTLLVLGEAVYLCDTKPAWHSHTQEDISTINDVLKLTQPGEYVMDAKAGAIFRPRPFYYVMETIARARIRYGLMPDDSPAQMAAKHTAVACLHGLTAAARGFVNQNYLPISATEDIFAAGKWLTPADAGGQEFAFEVVVPLPYTIVNKTGLVPGTLDGQPFTQPRLLAAGRHVFRSAAGQAGPLALCWSRAVEKGFPPLFAAQ